MSVYLQTNTADLVPISGKPFPLESVPRAVRDAGFTPGEMTITVSGSLVQAGTGWVLQLPGWDPLAVRWTGNPPPTEQVHRNFRVEFEQNQPTLIPVEP